MADTLQREHAGVVAGSRAAVSAAIDNLLDRQDARGWWSAELETNVTMTAEHVLLLAFLGLSHDRIREGAIRHLLDCQREDGSWGLYHDAPADLSTTIEAYVALRVLGLDGLRQELSSARRVILEQGGIAHARVFTKIWLALFGAHPWEGVPSMPPELVWLPPSVPLNLYDFACWARERSRHCSSSSPAGRGDPSRSRSTNLCCREPRGVCAASRRAGRSHGPTTSRSSTNGCASTPVAAPRGAVSWTGSATGRRPMEVGAASNRPGSTRSSRCISRACHSTTR